MFIEKISLINFRNILQLNIAPSEGLNIICGKNAQGKTNFLEAIYFCATGRTHRSNKDKDLINFEYNAAIAKLDIDNYISKNNIKVEISNLKKRIYVNNFQIKRLGDLYGMLYAVVFSPEDLQLVKLGPGLRRRFIDMELCQIYPVYYQNLRLYYKTLKQKNNLLKGSSVKRADTELFDVFDQQLYEYGKSIYKYRSNYINKLNNISKKIVNDITEQKEDMQILYKPNVNIVDLLEKLKKYREKDIVRGSTSVGIHIDDMEFKINLKNAKEFASQGQQRTAALAVKLATVELIKQEKAQSPVVLLDDVFSELDYSRQEYLLKSIIDTQVFITLTGAESSLNVVKNGPDVRFYRVEGGAFFED